MKSFIGLALIINFSHLCNGADIDRSFSKTDRQIDSIFSGERGAESQHAALQSFVASIDKVSEMPREESIPMLGTMLRKLSRKNIFQVSERVAVYDRAKEVLLTIPGHAHYYEERIREAYEPLKGPNPNLGINRAGTEMMYGFQTLEHIPSPETVKVLGEMLFEMWELPPTGEYTPPALAERAVITFGALNIREAPWRPVTTTGDLPGAIPAWQVWWEEVMSGQRAFSFEGQSVEYQFKPDGSWETTSILNPPDDEPKSPKAESVDRKQPAESPDAKGISIQSDSWPWVVGGTIVLLLIGLWLWVKRR